MSANFKTKDSAPIIDSVSKVIIIPPCSIGENVILENCAIGPNVFIENNCSIKNVTLLNSRIHANSEICGNRESE